MCTRNQILDRIKKSHFKAFTTADFLDLGSYKNVSKALETLKNSGMLISARRGVYCPAKKNALLGFIEPPDIDEVARAIARQYNFNIVPSSNFALNLIGVSTQVPSSYIYISDGPYREYQVGKMRIEFKHATSKEINGMRYKNLIAIQAIKALGKENVTDEIKEKISCFLDEKDKAELRKNQFKITAWIYDILKSIVGREKDV